MDRKRRINKRFIIVSGRVTRGGTLVLSAICKLLIDKGYDARMFYMNRVPGKDTDMRKWWIRQVRSYLSMPYIRLMCALNKKSQSDLYKIRRELVYEPIKGLPVQYLPFFNKDKTVVVYPEIIYGNFLKAKNVIRYLLYHNKLYSPDDPDSYGKDDVFIVYRSIFNDPVLNPEFNVFSFNWFDSQMYRQYNFGERSGACYILRKGRNRPDCPKTFDGPVIDDGLSEEEIVRIFNEHKYCYSYDPQTFYTTIAAVCGCIPIIVMEPGKDVKDYLSKWEANHYGQAYGDTPEQIQYAIDTRPELLKTLDYRELNERSINLFLDLVDTHFPD